MNQPKQHENEPDVDNRFFSMMQVHRRGNALSDLSAALREATTHAQLTGKTACITLKLSVKPANQIKGAILIEDKITVKLPEEASDNSIFYADTDGNLHREDPQQMKLSLRVIEANTAEAAAEPLRKVREA